MNCPKCNRALEPDACYCTHCGTAVETNDAMHLESTTSTKSGKIALTLCLLGGMLGIHRFYVGKIGTGLLMLLTSGGIGLWVLYDLILIIKNKFTDIDGHYILLTNTLTPVQKTLVILGAVTSWLILMALSLIALIVYLTSNLTDLVENQLSALKIRDLNKAYSFTSVAFQKNLPLERFEQFVAHLPFLQDNEHVSFTYRDINSDTGSLTALLTAHDGTTTSVEYKFIKEDGAWKILGFKVIVTQ